MKKNPTPYWQKSRIFLLFAFLLPLQPLTAFGQVDSLRRDSVPAPTDTTTKVEENIKANVTKVDTTAPAVYKLNFKSTIITSVVATAANMIAIPKIIHNKIELTPEELAGATQRRSFNFFDKWALDQDPTKRDKFYTISDHALTGIIVTSAATFLLNKRSRKDWLRLSLMFYKTQFLTFAFYDFSFFGPAFQNKLRPVVYYPYFSEEHRREGRQRNSLYSGHAANATAAAFFAAKVYCDYHPELGKKKFWVYSIAAVPSLFAGWLRVKSLAHFPSDAMIGCIIGASFGILVPESHRIKNKKLQVNTFFNGQAGGLHFTYKIGEKKKQPVS